MGRLSLLKLVWILLACICLSEAGAEGNSGEGKVKGAVTKDAKKSASTSIAKTERAWSPTKPTKTSLKRETLPIPSSKGGRSSSESLRTASQTLFGYNGANNNNNGYNNGFNNGGQFGGVGGAGGGFNNGYSGYPGGRQFAGFGGNGYNQYSQLGNQGYNVLSQQGQGAYLGGQGGQYYPNNGYFGGAGAGYNQYNPYASTGAYPFAGLSQNGFGGGGGFGGFNSGFNQGYYPGTQGYPSQVGNRNFGFINQGFGNPAFRNPQAGSAAISGGSGGINSIPSQVQVGTGLDVGSRGFGSNRGSAGGFPSASGQQYIVGNGIGQPAFIGGLMNGVGLGGSPEFGSPFGGGLYSPGIPGGIYRNQIRPSNSIFGLGPYDYPRTLSSPSPSPISGSRPGSTKLQTSSPNRFYQGVRPGGTYTPNSRERLYRYTSNES